MTKAVGDSLGDYLKKERESRRVSVDDMAGAIRISRELISALEDDRFAAFSQPEFVLGCLRLYSSHLGLNQDEVRKRADQAFIRHRQTRNHHGAKPFLVYNSPLSQAGKTHPGETLRRSEQVIKKVVFSVFIVLLIALFFFIPSEYKGPETILSDDLNKASVAGMGSSPQAVAPARARAEDAVPLATPPPTTEAMAPTPTESAVKIVGNRDSRRYHLPGMKYYGQVQAYHRVIFNSEEEAVLAGYTKAPR